MPKHLSLLKQLFGRTAKRNSTDFLSCHLLLILLSPRICYIIKNIPGALHAFLSCSQCDQCSVKLLYFFINAITVWTTLLVLTLLNLPVLYDGCYGLCQELFDIPFLDLAVCQKSRIPVYTLLCNLNPETFTEHYAPWPPAAKPLCKPAVLPSWCFVAFIYIQRYISTLWDQAEPLTTEGQMSPHCKVSNLKHWGVVIANISFDNKFYWHHRV